MGSFLQDLKHSIRMFLRAPGFTLTALAALALGVGANTAIFSLINTVLLKPVTAPDPDHVVVFLTNRTDGTVINGGSPARFNAWRELGDLFTDISAYRYGGINLTGVDSPSQFSGAQVSAQLFPAFRARRGAWAHVYTRGRPSQRGAFCRLGRRVLETISSRPIHRSREKRFHWAAILTPSSGSCRRGSRRNHLYPSTCGHRSRLIPPEPNRTTTSRWLPVSAQA